MTDDTVGVCRAITAPGPELDESEFGHPDLAVNTQSLVGQPNAFWPVGSDLIIAFDGGTAADHSFVLNAVKHWAVVANLRFLPQTNANQVPSILVGFDSNDGNTSAYGTQSAGRAAHGIKSMNIANLNHATVLHEFGHAIGLRHEHQSPAREMPWDEHVVMAVATKDWGWTRHQVEANILDPAPDGMKFSPFDPKSIMCYEIPASFLQHGGPIGGNSLLSPMDMSYIGDWYPFGGALQPCRFTRSTDHLLLFTRVVGPGRIGYQTIKNGVPQFGGHWADPPALKISGRPSPPVFTSPGDMEIAARREDGAPMIARQNQSVWSGWVSLGGHITGTPTLVRESDRMSLYVRGGSGRPFFKSRGFGGDWNTSASGWTHMGGSIIGDPRAVFLGNRTVITARAENSLPIMKVRTSVGWLPSASGWIDISPHGCSQAPVAAIEDFGMVYLFYTRQFARGLHIRKFDTNTESFIGPEIALGQDALGPPAAAFDFLGRLHVVARTPGRSYVWNMLEGQNWRGWTSLGGLGLDSPSIMPIPQADGRGADLRVFVTGLNRSPYTKSLLGETWSPGPRKWTRLSQEQVEWGP